MEKILVKDYAENKGVSVQAIYKMIREKKLITKKLNGKLYVMVDNLEENDERKDEMPRGNEDVLLKEIEMLRELNKQLEDNKNQLIKDKNELNERLKESHILQMKSLERVQLLEHKLESEVVPEPKKRKKVFGIF